MSTPNLSNPSFSNKAYAAAFGFAVRGGMLLEDGVEDEFNNFGFGVMAPLPLDAKFLCHGLTDARLLLSALDDEGE